MGLIGDGPTAVGTAAAGGRPQPRRCLPGGAADRCGAV